MSDISISRSNTEQTVSKLINKIRTEIIEGSAASADRIINAARHSAGDFIDSLKEEAAQEAAVVKLAGELLAAMADYIGSAAAAFADADETFNTTKV